ncbi:MAG: elongation factor G [Oscillospiraceae bacterium]|nr:elongation factor G [Oscillospiraceae bacterium]
MKQLETGKIKNVALAGHSGCGKTALAEALLFQAGVTDRLGKAAEGNTVCDYDPEEIKRKFSINLSLANLEVGENKINLIDTPGLFDFAAAMNEGLYAGDTVIICVSAKSGVHVGTKKAYEAAKKRGKHVMFVMTKIDDPNQDFYASMNMLKENFGTAVCPVVVPEIVDGKVKSLVHLGRLKSYTYSGKGAPAVGDITTDTVLSDKQGVSAGSLIDELCEAVAESDDALLEKFFEGEPFTQEEISHGIHAGMRTGKAMPVFAVSCATLAGIDLLLEFTKYLPAPDAMGDIKATGKDGKETAVTMDASAPVSAFVFKTIADPFVGKMSFIKVMSGTLSADKELVNATTGASERIGKLYTMVGKKQTEVSKAIAGDIVVATKIAANTGDTICAQERVIAFPEIGYPNPCYQMAVKAKAQGDEAKISTGIQRLLEEDKSLSYGLDSMTKEQILGGLGDQHLDIAMAKLKSKFGVDVLLEVPRIAYRETIRKKVSQRGKHKKQSGGHGQFGDVVIEFEPCDSDSLVFEERVFGGAVPKNFFPAVEKGLQDCVKKGVLAGCPVVGLKATLVDGSYHPVDSSEMAFKTAASLAYKEGLKLAGPVMLEPIGSLEVSIPDAKTGDVMGDLNKRRGRVLGMEPAGQGMTVISAEVPMREMHDFAMYLRQVARGMGEFTFKFLRYEQLPANLLDEVVASVKNSSDDED